MAPPYRRVALTFVEKFKSVEMEPDEFEEILVWFLDALENATLRRILDKLRETPISELEELDELLSKMEVRTAVALLQIIESNLAAIDALEQMHLDDAKERGVIQKHLERNSWLIHPTWMLSRGEGRVSKWIQHEFGLQPTGDPRDSDLSDFICVAVGGTLHIVEIKRGKHVAREADILQANKYRKYVLKRFMELTDPEAERYGFVQSLLIASDLHDDAEDLAKAFKDKGYVMFTTWRDLIQRAKRSHQQFREILSAVASA